MLRHAAGYSLINEGNDENAECYATVTLVIGLGCASSAAPGL
jgi:hypothetical protein